MVMLSKLTQHKISGNTALFGRIPQILGPYIDRGQLTPNPDSCGHNKYGKHWFHLDAPRHLHIYNERNLGSLVESAGLKVTSCRPTIRDANWTHIASRAYQRGAHYKYGEASIDEKLIGLALLYWEYFMHRKNSGEMILHAQR